MNGIHWSHTHTIRGNTVYEKPAKLVAAINLGADKPSQLIHIQPQFVFKCMLILILKKKKNF